MMRLLLVTLAALWGLAGVGASRQGSGIQMRASAGLFLGSLRVDYIVNDTRSCADFWAESGVGQTQPPATAYRGALRALFQDLLDNDSNLEKKGKVKVRRVGLKCKEPDKKLGLAGAKRITALVKFSPNMVLQDMNYLVNEAYGRAEECCRVHDGIAERGGSGWVPGYFEYKPVDEQNSPTKYFAICVQGDSACYYGPWNPKRTVPYVLTCPPNPLLGCAGSF